MAQFKPGETIETEEPVVTVDLSPDEPLPVGKHVFQLIVFDDTGNPSEAAFADVIIRDTQRPTAVLDAPREVEAGESFDLNGKRSSDVAPGKVVTYAWTLLEGIHE